MQRCIYGGFFSNLAFSSSLIPTIPTAGALAKLIEIDAGSSSSISVSYQISRFSGDSAQHGQVSRNKQIRQSLGAIRRRIFGMPLPVAERVREGLAAWMRALFLLPRRVDLGGPDSCGDDEQDLVIAKMESKTERGDLPCFGSFYRFAGIHL